MNDEQRTIALDSDAGVVVLGLCWFSPYAVAGLLPIIAQTMGRLVEPVHCGQVCAGSLQRFEATHTTHCDRTIHIRSLMPSHHYSLVHFHNHTPPFINTTEAPCNQHSLHFARTHISIRSQQHSHCPPHSSRSVSHSLSSSLPASVATRVGTRLPVMIHLHPAQHPTLSPVHRHATSSQVLEARTINELA